MKKSINIPLLIAALLLLIPLSYAALNIQDTKIKVGSEDEERTTEFTNIEFNLQNTASFSVNNLNFNFNRYWAMV